MNWDRTVMRVVMTARYNHQVISISVFELLLMLYQIAADLWWIPALITTVFILLGKKTIRDLVPPKDKDKDQRGQQ